MRSVKALCWPWSHIFLTETRRGDSPRALSKVIKSQIARSESRERMRTRLDHKDLYAPGGGLCGSRLCRGGRPLSGGQRISSANYVPQFYEIKGNNAQKSN